MTLRYDEAQLRFDLPGLDDVQDQAADQAITPDQARLISEAARQELVRKFGSGEMPAWAQDYLTLLQYGWPWRVACYIAWASAPKASRKPETLEKLAVDVLGLTGPRVIYTWRKKFPSIDAVIGMMQGAVLFEHRRDVLEALADMAKERDYKAFNDRKLFLEMIGDYTPKSKLELRRSGGTGPADLSDDELRRWAGDDDAAQETEVADDAD